MKSYLIIACMVLGAALLSAQIWAVCPEEPFDNGECDTLHVDIHPPDQPPSGNPPYLVRFPIRVTHDIVDAAIDSLSGFTIPLCYTHSNSAAYCSLTHWWNTTILSSFIAGFERSIFRPLNGEDNQLQLLYNNPMYPPYVFLDLDGTSHFWFAFAPTGSSHQRIPDGSRMLIATMTFKMEDTATVCIDSCFWPPSDRLAFGNSSAQLYVPRHYLPVCETVGGFPPTRIDCPGGESRSANGTYQSGIFQAYCDGGYITEIQVWADLPLGISDAQIVYTVPPEADYVEGYVEYTVSDHCQPGGNILLAVFNNIADGPVGECFIPVEFTNNPPFIEAPDTLLAIAGATRACYVQGSDPDNDAVGTSFNAMWYEPDSLQPPTNPPSYVEGNPGFFSWLPTETEQGTWICSFTATDVCGGENVGEMTILVGPLFCGDNTGEGEVTISDVIMLIHWLYKAGEPPDPLCKGDANCDGVVDVGDVVRLLNYLFKFGNAPCFECCAGGL